MRGEDTTSLLPSQEHTGSPPHARGRRSGSTCLNMSYRITPACAGKTTMRARPCKTKTDHPRMRGEDVEESVGGLLQLGSPPHARGRLDVTKGDIDYERITPACAGKTIRRVSSLKSSKDHPRMRGEDLSFRTVARSVRGSPPHARGRRTSRRRARLRGGITPACAGKTPLPPRTSLWTGDHPRMRGEDKSACFFMG